MPLSTHYPSTAENKDMYKGIGRAVSAAAVRAEYGGNAPDAHSTHLGRRVLLLARVAWIVTAVGAVGLFLASLTHAGLVTLTHTPNPMGFLGTLLARPRNERAYVVIPVGYPAPGAAVPAHALAKKPLDQILVRVADSTD